MRWLKEHHPETYFFNNLRCNAKRRGHQFTLTLQEFKQFCKKTNYLKLKGKTKNSASIDRIRSWEGYNINNIQILTLSENTIKRNKERKCPF